MGDRVRVVVATAQTAENIELLRSREPRLDVVFEPSLLGPASDNWMVRHESTPEEQARFDELLDTAEVLFGVPDHSGAALARTVAANPALRWVHTIPAGGGQQVKAAHLDADALARILFTTSAGGHAEPRPPGPPPVPPPGGAGRGSRSRSSPCSAFWPARSCCPTCARRRSGTS